MCLLCKILFVLYRHLIKSKPDLQYYADNLLYWLPHAQHQTQNKERKTFNEPLWQDYSVSDFVIQQKILVHGKYVSVSIDLTSLSARLAQFQPISTEDNMNSSNDSTGGKPYKTECNSTCIQVKQVPIFPQGWGSRTVNRLHGSIFFSDFISFPPLLTVLFPVRLCNCTASI